MLNFQGMKILNNVCIMTVYNQLPTQQNLNATMWIQQGFPASPNVPHATAVRLTKF